MKNYESLFLVVLITLVGLITFDLNAQVYQAKNQLSLQMRSKKRSE